MNLVVRTLLFVSIIHGFFLAVLPALLLWTGFGLFRYPSENIRLIGVFLAVTGINIYASTVYDFIATGRGTPAAWDSPAVFVRKGFYRFVRNPMYVGMFLILAGEAVFFGSLLLWVYAAVLWLCFHLFVVFYEEPALKKKFGQTYETYLKEVPRWVPCVRG
ncbi:MAG: methyltransferase family protein [Candidatus Omnitrophota bacterium]